MGNSIKRNNNTNIPIAEPITISNNEYCIEPIKYINNKTIQKEKETFKTIDNKDEFNYNIEKFKYIFKLITQSKDLSQKSRLETEQLVIKLFNNTNDDILEYIYNYNYDDNILTHTIRFQHVNLANIIIDRIIKSKKLNILSHRTKTNGNALYYAINFHLDEIALRLLDLHRNNNIYDYDCITTYSSTCMLAVFRNKPNLQILNKLLETPELCNLETQNIDGYNIFAKVCHLENVDIINKFLDIIINSTHLIKDMNSFTECGFRYIHNNIKDESIIMKIINSPELFKYFTKVI